MVKNNGGWTLIELLIVLVIISIVVMMTPRFLTQITQVFILGRSKIELQQQARSIMYLMTRELRQAQSNTIVIDRGTATQPYYSRIRFTKAQGTNVTVAQSGSSVILTEGINSSTLTKNLAFMSFSFPRSDDMTIVSVSFTLQKLIYGGSYKALHMASERVRVMN